MNDAETARIILEIGDAAERLMEASFALSDASRQLTSDVGDVDKGFSDLSLLNTSIQRTSIDLSNAQFHLDEAKSHLNRVVIP